MTDNEIENLVAIVAKMRELGVTEYTTPGGATVRLGEKPPPAKRELTKEEAIKAMEERQRKHHETQFAACHVAPRLRVLKGG